jgi:8-amino-7-oxononanoate synthase
MKKIEKFIYGFEKRGLYPDFHTITDNVNEPEVTVDGKKYLMFCSNNYLAMSQNEAVKKAGIAAIEKYGVGPGGSRVISGNIDIIEKLEAELADLTGTEDCLTFPTGYMANVGVIRAMMDALVYNYPHKSEDSVIFSDEYNHGSIVDGCKLSKATKVIFNHDDLTDLEQKLKENRLPNKLIITEGVFSLDGEIIKILDYIELAKKYKAKLMVDDAHGIGVLGEHGGGVADLFDCGDQIDIVMGCMDKAFGGTGGYLCGNKVLIKYLRIACRSSILSSAIPAMMAGAMVESAKQIRQGQELRKTLFDNARYLKNTLSGLGFKMLGRDEIPSLALYVGKEDKGIKFAKILWEEKVFCPIIRWPAVPAGQTRFRIIVMTNHTKAHLDRFAEACKKAGKTLGMIQ